MSSLTAAPIGIPPTNGLWARLKSLWTKAPEHMSAPMESHGLPERVAELEAEVAVLQTQVEYAQTLLQNLQVQVGAWGTPQAVLPTDVYLGGRRYTETGDTPKPARRTGRPAMVPQTAGLAAQGCQTMVHR